MNLTFEQILLFLLTILPFFYKYSFWLYTIQLKEYRLDRFREYLWTLQWKAALFNFWFFIELPLIIVWASIFFNYRFEIMIFPIIFYFLVFYNIFVIGKLVRKNFLKPKLTGRLLITLLLLVAWFSIDFYFILFWGYWTSVYVYILGSLIFAPVIIFSYIFLSLPVVNYLKNRKIKKAINKSNNLQDIIKIWITGSYGKSSVKEFLSSILEQDWELLKTPENINSELWVSAIVLNKLSEKYKYFVAEMWAYRIWEISLLWKIVNHKYWFLTAIWNQHLWLFGGQENIKEAKSEIQESVLKNNGVLYINWNNESIRNTVFDTNMAIIKYGNYDWTDAQYSDMQLQNGKTQFHFSYNSHWGIEEDFEIDMIWEHNVINITWVIACCLDLWLESGDIKKYLKNLVWPKGTKNIVEISFDTLASPHSISPKGREERKIILIDDTYNLSEAGLLSGLELLNSYDSPLLTSPKGRGITRILVLDDILELWKESNGIHLRLWKKLAEEKLADKVLFCGVNYKTYFEKWLIEGGFDEKNIIWNLEGLDWESVILFEGRKAKGWFERVKG